jgi:hypothetical protein
MKKTLILVSAILFIAFVCICVQTTRTQIRKMLTGDTMAQIIYAVSKLMVTEWPDNADIVAKTKVIFPSIPISEGKIVDAWGEPLVIAITCDSEQLRLSLASSGKDKVMGTEDDITRKVEMFFDPIAPTNGIPYLSAPSPSER